MMVINLYIALASGLSLNQIAILGILRNEKASSKDISLKLGVSHQLGRFHIRKLIYLGLLKSSGKLPGTNERTISLSADGKKMIGKIISSKDTP